MTESPQEMFYKAAGAGDMELLREAYRLGAIIDHLPAGQTMLHYACIHGQNEVVKQLLEWNAEINVFDQQRDPRTPFMRAVEYGNVEAMRLLMEHGADVNLKSKKGTTLSEIVAAIRANPDEVLELLLGPYNDEAAYPKPLLYSLNRLLSHAVIGYDTAYDFPDEKAVAALIRRGAHGHEMDLNGSTILHSLISIGAPRLGVTRTRTEHIAKVIKHTLEAGVSPLLKDKAGILAIFDAYRVPEFHEVFVDACKSRALQGLAEFRPAISTLVNPHTGPGDPIPTDLALYCSHADMLGEALTRERWNGDLRALVEVKQALIDALPPYHAKQSALALDATEEYRLLAKQGLVDFKPALETLVGKDGKPTELAMDCCHAGILDEALSRERWKGHLRALIKVKHELKAALPPCYQEQYEGALDITSERRDEVDRADSVLKQRLRTPGGRPRT